MTQLEEKKKRAAAYIETLIKTAYFMIRKRWALSDNLSEMIDFLGNDPNGDVPDNSSFRS